jgi:hypothetical protein
MKNKKIFFPNFKINIIYKMGNCTAAACNCTGTMVALKISPPGQSFGGSVGQPFSQTFTINNATSATSVTFSIDAISGWLTFDISNLPSVIVSGIPPMIDNYNFTLSAMDPIATSDIQSYTIVVLQ